MTQTPILSLPYIAPSQAQKHVTHNEALRLVDILIQLSIKSRTTSTPPAVPDVGDRYVVAATATGAWAGHEDDIAVMEDTGWRFVAPQAGWVAMATDEMELFAFDGIAWDSVRPSLGISDLANLEGIGINTTADLTNKLAIAADATLLSHDGNGHQVKVNKAAGADTASLLFQSNWTGHAEMGLAGDTDFSVKVSDDGSNWFTALAADGATGRVSFPNGGVRELLAADTTFYVDPTSGSDGTTGRSGGAGAFATIQRAVDEVLSIDAGGRAVTIQLADDTYVLSSPIVIDQPLIGGGEIAIVGNVITPSSVTLSSTVGVFDCIGAVASITGVKLVTGSGVDVCLHGSENAQIAISDVVFGTGGTAHISLQNAECVVEGDYEITGDADRHIALDHGAVFRMEGHTLTLTGTPDFATAFVEATNGANASFDSNTFSGSATGPRYEVTVVSSVNTYGGGAAHLPGGSAGSTSDGGVYL